MGLNVSRFKQRRDTVEADTQNPVLGSRNILKLIGLASLFKKIR